MKILKPIITNQKDIIKAALEKNQDYLSDDSFNDIAVFT